MLFTRFLITIGLLTTLHVCSAQGRQSSNAVDRDQVVRVSDRALVILGLDPGIGTILPLESDKSRVFVYYKTSRMIVDHVRKELVSASNEVLSKEIERRALGQSVIRRSDARWAELGLEVAKKLWPTAILTLKKVTRYPEEGRSNITGLGSSRSNTINLEYRGTVGNRIVRADIVFDQVTGKVSFVRMGDLPKPR